MTLIINAVNSRFAIQASDTRLTRGGNLADDFAVKTTVLGCDNAVLIISYTGIATVDKLRTDEWLVTELTDFKAGTKTIGEIISHLKIKLAEEFKIMPYPAEQKMLTFTFAGWAVNKFGETNPLFISLSNFEDKDLKTLKKPNDFFQEAILKCSKRNCELVIFNGTEPSLDQEFFKKRVKRLRKKLKSAKSLKGATEVANHMVNLIRSAAKHPSYGKYVGSNCIIAILPLNEFTAQVGYSPLVPDGTFYTPNLVNRNLSIKGVFGKYE